MNVRDKGIAVFGGAAVFMLVVTAGSALTARKPSHPVQARVVQIYTSGARFPTTVIVAHAPGTIEAHGLIRYEADDHCHLGDVVDGVQTGISLKVDPTTCRAPQRSSTNRP